MAVTVIDSSDVKSLLADAGVELEQQAAEPAAGVSAEQPAGEVEHQPAKAKAEQQHDDPDDIEGDDGFTPREKRELTEKMQKAIGKKHRMLKEAEEFAAAQYSERKLAEQRAEALERELAELKGKGQPAKAEEPEAEKPKRENFATESEYIDASIEWGVQEGLRKKAAAEAREAADRAQAQLLEAAKGRITRAIELVPDFEDVIGGVNEIVPPVVAGYMQKSEMFAELGYHLAKNPELLVSLSKLPPDEQLVKIGKIESTLQSFGSKETRDGDEPSTKKPNGQPSKAAPSDETGIAPSKARSSAPVITPLNGSGTAGAGKDHKDMNIREAITDYAKRNQVNFSLRKRH